MKCLFEDYKNQPKELVDIFTKYEEKLINGMNYNDITEFHNEVYNIGYTFDSGLDAEPFGLRPINIELNQLEGFEDIDN